MKMFLHLAACLILAAGADAAGSDIYELIINGDLEAAADSLSRTSTATLRDGNMLYYAGMVETGAEKSVQLMEAALNASVAAVHQEDIYCRLAQYYFIQGDYGKLGRIVADYLVLWESGKYRREMQRFSIVVDEKSNAYESALKQADRYFLLYGDGDAAQWGKIDRSRVMLGYGKNIGADNVLRRLAREKDGPGVPQALYLLTLDAIKRRRTDDAVFYYNILREGYPSAVGLDALIERMKDLSLSGSQGNAAEKLTGTFYSVQVGVFSVEANSSKQAELFGKYGKKVDVKSKKISQAKYHVVYVGRFSDYEAAARFKRKLEDEHGEVFQVVAR
ncbi:MAG: SPOR domain-containing protein [candidate division Zixibacteria bacterium]|nr:SPOR domain-containing protein [candidate division Zixibacteria bacterium]